MQQLQYEDYQLLIVDDEQEICEALKELLEIQGWNVLTCNNGFEALSIIDKNKIDVLISDIRMPKCTGYDLLTRLKPEQKDSMTIIMMSAYSDYDEDRLIKLGAKKQLSKPINGMQLTDCINSLLIDKLIKN